MGVCLRPTPTCRLAKIQIFWIRFESFRPKTRFTAVVLTKSVHIFAHKASLNSQMEPKICTHVLMAHAKLLKKK